MDKIEKRNVVEGLFISMEGPDGAGKTTVIEQLLPRLQSVTNHKIHTTREPGGSKIAEQIREVILDVNNQEMDAKTEAILYAAARRQHLVDRILPYLAQGDIVFCDRFVDSSSAYQGVARDLGIDEIKVLNHFATDGLLPHVTLYLDIPSEVGLLRIEAAKGCRQYDRLDQEGLAFHQNVRKGYLEVIKQDEERFIVIDATQSIEEVTDQCFQKLVERYPSFFRKREGNEL